VAARRYNSVPAPLRTLFNVGVIRDMTDGQLLERVAGGGEAAELAFAALLERHGPVVLHACRSILRDEHDAEDAFQATFLVLVRKARSLWVRDSLGPWLHQVAYRAARCSRSAASRRTAHERGAAEAALARRDPRAAEDCEQLAAAMHEEIERMPERYRAPLVLCDLEGRTHEQAARHLGCPVGTVKSRLARGRQQLGDRLTRRGLDAPAPVAIVGAISPSVRVVPSALLVESTTRAAMQIAAGRPPAEVVSAAVSAVMKGAMERTSMDVLKGTAWVLGFGALVGGLAAAGLHGAASDPPRPSETGILRSDSGGDGPRSAAPDAGVAADLRGRWEVLYLAGSIAGKREGYATPGLIVPVTNETINLPALTGNPRDPLNYLGEMRYAVDPGMKAGAIDMKGGPDGGKLRRGIYRLKADILTVCYDGPGAGRPETFAGDRPSESLIVLRRLAHQPAAPPRQPGEPVPPPTGPGAGIPRS
jgi:RNA polymerase sigma factor (sigma-70 family)